MENGKKPRNNTVAVEEESVDRVKERFEVTGGEKLRRRHCHWRVSLSSFPEFGNTTKRLMMIENGVVSIEKGPLTFGPILIIIYTNKKGLALTNAKC